MTDSTHNREKKPLILGIDIGSVSAALAVLTPDREILHTDYRFHHGEIAGTMENMLASVEKSAIAAVAVTDGTPERLDADWRCDDRIAVIAAAGHFHV